MKWYAIVLIVLVSAGCGKKVLKLNSEMEGTWRHNTSDIRYEEFVIHGDSRDRLREVESGAVVVEQKGKKWFIQNGGHMSYGRMSPFIKVKSNRAIEEYPSVAISEIIDGHDTIPAGRTFMIISGRYYLKVE